MRNYFIKNKSLSHISLAMALCLTPVLTLSTAMLPTMALAKVEVADFSNLVEQVAPSVARVNVTKKMSSEEMAQIQMALLLRRYLGERVPDSLPPVTESSFGTAFFVSNDGYMLTNYHVIEGADKVTVTLNDRQELDATVVGGDERTDMAVLKVAGNGFPALPVGDSEKLKVGESVLAIGSPFGFDYSASAGIVSAKSRSFSKDTTVPFIQTDVALNPGNSGGPLFNQKGEVVGVNSRIFTGTGGYMGLSFSIPMDVAMDVYEQIRQTGTVSRAYLGVFPQDIDRNLADAYGLAKPVGALIARVSPNSPAQKAGLKSGDVVLSFNNQTITTSADLTNLVSRAKPNDNFSLQILRNGKNQTLQGTLVKAPSDTTSDTTHANGENPVKLGLRLRALSAEEQQALRVNGVLITAVDPFGLAASAGIQAGDVIVQLNNQDVLTVQDFAKSAQNLPKKGVVTVQLIRQGEPKILGLRIE
nr:Do family serine endopeptidase [uncultured Moraxella sp.]